ncbi:efflux RND transporter periplasmic adaptor subunit [Saccharospirillum alexandrii]|uniref:efflux RND transporter periplasmic adaptor subunit n=1 Tax=Saccharospirillum alexandrii TaxID=2448477 RepID=UPI003736773C
MSSRWVRWSLPLVVLGAGVAGALWMNDTSEPSTDNTAEAEPQPLVDAPTVATVRPDTGRWSPQLMLYPRYQSRQSVVLTSPVAANVESVEVAVGQSVEAGAVLLQLDADALQRQVTQLEAQRSELASRSRLEQSQYQSDQAALVIEQNLVAIAQRSVDRLQNLARQNLSSAADLEAAERTLQNQRLALQQRELAIARYDDVEQQLAAQRDQLDSQLEQARDNLNEATITAPFAGRIASLEVRPGTEAGTGSALLTLVNDQDTEWVAWVAASALPEVDALSSLTAVVETDAGSIPVELRQRDPVADRGSVRLYFEAENEQPRATLNRTYSLRLDLPAIQAHRVPDASVYANESVYRVVDNRLERVQIRVLGEQFDQGRVWRLIEADLNPDDRLLGTRLQQAADGLAVKVSDQ